LGSYFWEDKDAELERKPLAEVRARDTHRGMNILSFRQSVLIAAIVTLGGQESSAFAADKKFEVGVGVYGAGGVVGLSKPTDKTVTIGGVQGIDSTYPGFFGGTGGVGLMLDARAFQAIGVEVDLYYGMAERGKGDLSVGGIQSYTIKVGQSALHVPILLKGTLPVGSVRPFLAIGPELVFPGKSEAVVTPTPPAGGTTFAADAASYVLFTAALGAEIRLPIPKLDIRIPFSLRASKNFATSDKIVDRRTAALSGQAITSISYKSEWELQGLFTLGAAIYF
jgi:hypothetical protein